MPITIPVGLDTDALDRQFSGLESKARSSGKAVGDSFSSGAKKAEKSADDAAKGLEDLGDAAGLPVDKLKKLAGGFAALANPVTLAIVGIGAVALGMVAAAAGIVKATQEAEKLAEAMKPLRDQEGFGISKSSLTGITSANDALRALSAIADQFIVSMGAEFAPTVERVAMMLVKLGLMALDAFNTFASGKDVLHELAVFMVEGLIGAATGVVNALFNVVDVMAEVARAAGQGGLADQLKSVTQHWKDFKTELAEDLVAKLGEKFVEAEEATGSYDERAKKLVGTVKRLGQAHKEAKKQVSTYAASLKAMDEDAARVDKITGALDKLTASALTSANSRLDGEAKIKAALEDQLAALEEVYQQGVRNADSDAQRLALLAAYENARTEAILANEEAIRASKAETAEQDKQQAEDAAKRAEDATLGAIEGLQGGLESIATLIGGPVAGAIAGLVLNLEETVTGLIEQLKSLPGIVKSIPKLAIALVKGIMAVIPELVAAIPVLITGVIDAIPEIVVALIVGLINAIPSLIVAAVKLFVTYLAASSGYLAVKIVVEIVKGLVDAIPVMVNEAVSSFREWWAKFTSGELTQSMIDAAKAFALALWNAVKLYYDKLIDATKKTMQKWLDMWKEVFTLGRAETSLDGSRKKSGDVWKELVTLGMANTATYGDAPSMQRAGPQGANVRTSAGDYFLAGRNPQALLEQALNGALGAGAAPVMAGGGGQVNMAWQHRAFDGFFVRHAQLGGQTSGLFKTMNTSKDARGM